MQNFKGMLAEFYDQASMLLGLPDISFSPIDFIEILIIAFLFYHILLWIKSTKAWNLAGRENLKCRADRIGYHFSAGTS